MARRYPKRCASVQYEPAIAYRPTAAHAVAVAQSTPASSVDADPGGTGLATTVQLAPFHRSVRGRCDSLFPDGFCTVYPTAAQLAAASHETLTSALLPLGSGPAATDHFVPFQRRMNGLV